MGAPVVFANADGVSHSVTAGTAAERRDAFDSGEFGPGQSYRLRFDEPGTYSFYCTLHPQMTGEIVVEDPA